MADLTAIRGEREENMQPLFFRIERTDDRDDLTYGLTSPISIQEMLLVIDCRRSKKLNHMGLDVKSVSLDHVRMNIDTALIYIEGILEKGGLYNENL